jgi:outer membrane protein OmpA-like peptidoglycan-associated protein
MKLKIVLIIFCFSYTDLAYGQKLDTFQVYFALNEIQLNSKQDVYIDSLVAHHKLAPGYKMRLLGYADYLGKEGHNDSLSRSRARYVQNHLLTAGFDRKDITVCAGEGGIQRNTIKLKGGYAADRKVLIITDHVNEAAANKESSLPDIKTVKINDNIALKNIFFREGLPDIAPISYAELEQLLAFLNENKTVTIQIEGHICCLAPESGTDVPFEQSTLSALRAKSVYDYLVSKGIDKNRLKYIGLGNTRPAVSPELTDEDMEKNRRVEIRVLSK